MWRDSISCTNQINSIHKIRRQSFSLQIKTRKYLKTGMHLQKCVLTALFINHYQIYKRSFNVLRGLNHHKKERVYVIE